MKTHATHHFHRAFTLVELLVVIAIMATLATISMTGMSKFKERAKITAAKNDLQQLRLAMTTYYSEYNRWPLTSTGDGPFKLEGTLLDALTNGGSSDAQQLNRRGIVCFPVKKPAKGPKEHGYYQPENRLNDPWGNAYALYVDGDDDGEMAIPPGYEIFGTGTTKNTLLIISAGRDGKLETVRDNVLSWE